MGVVNDPYSSCRGSEFNSQYPLQASGRFQLPLFNSSPKGIWPLKEPALTCAHLHTNTHADTLIKTFITLRSINFNTSHTVYNSVLGKLFKHKDYLFQFLLWKAFFFPKVINTVDLFNTYNKLVLILLK